MGTVAITGAGGYIGQRLVVYLENQNWCTKILGTDIIEPRVTSSKLDFLTKTFAIIHLSTSGKTRMWKPWYIWLLSWIQCMKKKKCMTSM